MTRSISVTLIEKTLFQSAKTAADRYMEVSGGYGLFDAPESYLQAQIFDGLAKPKPIFVTLESSPKKISLDHDIKRDGRSDKMKLGQRFDVLIWYANGRPRIIIEVKKIYRRNFSAALKDVRRMRPWIDRNQPNIQGGYLLIYTEAVGKNANEKISRRIGEFRDLSGTRQRLFEIIHEESGGNYSRALSLLAVLPQR